MRKHLYLLLVVLGSVTISAIGIGGRTALASSLYDDNYNVTDSLIVDGTTGSSCTPTDITHTWPSYILDSAKWRPGDDWSAARASLLSAFANTTNGQWGVSQSYVVTNNPYNTPQNGYVKSVYVFWSEDPNAHFDWATWGGSDTYATAYTSAHLNVASINCSDLFLNNGDGKPIVTGVNLNANSHSYLSKKANTPVGYQGGQAVQWSTISNLFAYNINTNLPVGYAGVDIPNGTVDADGDGLTIAQESTQGTSDDDEDTDGDGLSDFIESVYNPNRDTIFCGSECAYPNPIAKDLYVEVDWMKDANDRVFRPGSDQLDLVKNAFAAHGVTVHFDTGQYGGGNELSTYAEYLYFAPNPNETDFFDYKNGTSIEPANFKADRNGIWHYLISGYRYVETPSSSGVSYAGSDAVFISTGLIEDNSSSFGYSDLDTAMAGTIIHELGHSICLSNPTTGDPAYSTQSSSCRYSNVDNWNAPSTYNSSMNYNKQMFMVGYSDGTNGAPGDHDDWSAVNASLADFSKPGQRIEGTNEGAEARQAKSLALVRGITVEEAQKAKNEDILGSYTTNTPRRVSISGLFTSNKGGHIASPPLSSHTAAGDKTIFIVSAVGILTFILAAIYLKSKVNY